MSKGSIRTTTLGWIALVGWIAAGLGYVVSGDEVPADQVTGIIRAFSAVGVETSQELVVLVSAVGVGLVNMLLGKSARDDGVSTEEARRAKREKAGR